MDNDIPKIVVRVLQGTQNEDEMRAFMRWCNSSRENKELFFQLKHIYELRRDGIVPNEEEILASWERLMRKARNEANKKTIHIPRLTGVAIIFLLLLALGTHFYLKQDRSVEWVEITTDPRSEPREVSLPDGSIIQLNASTSLRYPKKFNRKQREVHLDGEAYFSVANKSRRPFIVHTDRQRVNVLGTEFNLLAYSSDPYTVTTLVNGRVRLELCGNHDSIQNEVSMSPKQQVYYDKGTMRATLLEVDPTEYTSWLNGVYSFKDAPLEQIANRLEKVHGVNLIIQGDELRRERYTGKFFSNQSLEEVTNVLNFKGQYLIEFDDENLYMRLK